MGSKQFDRRPFLFPLRKSSRGVAYTKVAYAEVGPI